MKAIMITFDQAHEEGVIEALNHSACRGFTSFGEVTGRGSKTGDPHYGSHAWPALGGAIFTVVEPEKVEPLLRRLKALDENRPLLGVRAFVWEIESMI